MAYQHAFQPAAFTRQFAHDLAKGTFADLSGHDRQGISQIVIPAISGKGQYFFLNVGHGFGRSTVIHDFKMRCQPGFERETAQQ